MDLMIALWVSILVVLIWLNLVAILTIWLDPSLTGVQKIFQLLFVLLIPFIGATTVLKFVHEHSPEAIPYSWIPWPFKTLIFGVEEKKRSFDREDYDTWVSPESSSTRNRRNDSSEGGGDAGGGD